MEKFCVFCGEKPQTKNLEHVIPQWLIKLTGDPNREISLGIDWFSEEFKIRKFAFNSLKFPACKFCNEKHSKLEESAKLTMQNLLAFNTLTAEETNTFLDWIDKIRIGLWLCFHYFDKNYLGIRPNFYIEKRIGLFDRLIFIYSCDEVTNGINFFHCGNRAFQFSPSCFCLRVNNIFIFNMSYSYCLSRRLGFPYPSKLYFLSNQTLSADFENGRERIMLPLIKWPYNKRCIEVYQPIFSYNSILESDGVNEFYENEYVYKNSLLFDRGIGKIFFGTNDTLNPVEEINISYLNNFKFDDVNVLFKFLSNQVLDFQNKLLDEVSLEKMSPEEKRKIKKEYAIAKNMNKLIASSKNLILL